MAARKSVGDEAAAAFEAERFLGAGPERPMLSMQRAYAVHTHGTVTGRFVGSIARRSRDGREPPPPNQKCRSGPSQPGGLSCVRSPRTPEIDPTGCQQVAC
jgi:hypothetical protein